MVILLATNNPNKRTELQEIWQDASIKLPTDFGIEFDFHETGSTFLENALGKAQHLYGLVTSAPDRLARQASSDSDLIVAADDSGICVDFLSGGPGIYSARFGSPDGGATELSSVERNRLLLESMESAEDRGASFVCCMAAVASENRLWIAQESWRGSITTTPSKGVHGFGYDPVFLVHDEGVTSAELDPATKNRLSHRGKAARALWRMIERLAVTS